MPLEARNIVAGYSEDIDILLDVSMYAEDGKITCMIGPNGVGKSTLLKTIYGFLEPKKGKICYNGNDVTNEKPYNMLRMGISYIPQLRSVFPYLTVEDNLKLGGWIFRGDAEKVKEGIEEVYGRFPVLMKKRKSRAGMLSGGEQRMLEIGRTLIVKPKIMLVDEPSAGLAPKLVTEVYNRLNELREEGMTILLVDQNIRKAVEYSNYVYVLELGKVKLEGVREEFEDKLDDIIRGVFTV